MENEIKVMEDLGVVSEDVELPFPIYEYKNRLNKVRKEMQERGIDLLYLTMPESMYYVSGLKLNWYQINSSPAWDSSKVTGIAINVNSDKFILFAIPDEEHAVLGSTCAEDARFIPDVPGEVLMFGKKLRAAEKLPMDLIIEDLKAEGWLKGRAALEKGSPRPSWKIGQKLEEAFLKNGCGEVVDGTDILLGIRGKKSPLELNYIEKASKLADIGHRAIAAGLAEGMTERELVSVYTDAMFKAGGESMAIVDQVGFGKGKRWWVHSPAGRKRLMPGDPVRVDLCGVYNRYHANQARFYSFGKPDKALEEDCKRSAGVMEKVQEIIKPNMYIRDFWDEVIAFMKKEGIWGQQYWLGGYELGISFPPDWCGNLVYDAFVDPGDSIFETGTVVNFETGFGGVDTLVFKEDEALVLGNTPWGLQTIEPEV